MHFIDLQTQYKRIKATVDERIQKVLDNSNYIGGEEVRELESRLSSYTGSKYTISTASGTDSLQISLMALGLKAGDEVITTPFTFYATVEVMMLLGIKPVFVDIEPDTCNIDASQIEQYITEKTKGIMPVGIFGQCSDMDKINEVANKYSLPVIEDGAQSFGAEYKGVKSGNLSTIGCTSFFPSKPLGCYGDGGAIFTNDEELAIALKEIAVHGMPSRYYHTRVGVCSRLDSIQAAVLLSKLDIFDAELSSRLYIGDRYNKLINSSNLSDKIKPIKIRPDRTSVYAQYTVMLEDRERVVEGLKEKGIPTAVHYPLSLLDQPIVKEYGFRGDKVCPKSQKAANSVLSLPMHPYLDEKTQNTILEAITSLY